MRQLLIIIAVGWLTAIAALTVGIFEPRAQVNFRLTYNVEQEGEFLSTSGVLKATTRGTRYFNVNGEAIPLELASGEMLFFTRLGGEPVCPFEHPCWGKHSIGHWKLFQFAFRDYREDSIVKLFRKLRKKKAATAIPAHWAPTMYLAANADDLSTFKEIQFTELISEGIVIRKIMLEITEEKITEGRIEAIVPWLDEIRNDHPWIYTRFKS